MGFRFEMIVAYSRNYGIGIKNKLPWTISNDLKRFKKLTEHNVVIMGKNTFVSIPDRYKPLPNRINIVLTSNPDQLCFKPYENTLNLFIITLNKLQAVLQQFHEKRIFIIGGKQIYDLFLPQVQIIHATCVYKMFHDCDTYINMDRIKSDFGIANATPFMWCPEEECNYKYIMFTRRVTNLQGCKKST